MPPAYDTRLALIAYDTLWETTPLQLAVPAMLGYD